MTLRFLLCANLIGASPATGCAPTWTSTITYPVAGVVCHPDDPMCHRKKTKTVKHPGRCQDAGPDLDRPGAYCTDKQEDSAGTVLAVVGLVLALVVGGSAFTIKR